MLCDIAAAFLHDPTIVFLDEPTIGIDISVKAKIRTVIRQLNAECKTTILLTTHDISDIEALCKRVVIIDKGKVIFDDAIQKVTHLFGSFRTLKVQIFPLLPETLAQFAAKVQAQFTTQEPLVVAGDEGGWINITINEDQAPLPNVLNFAISAFTITHFKISDYPPAS